MAVLGKTSITELSLLNPLSIENGGTEATTKEGALAKLGVQEYVKSISASGTNITYTLGNGTSQTFSNIQGAKGIVGKTGSQGATGFQGGVGATGSGGYQGAKGPKGATGSGGYQGAIGGQGPQGAGGFQGAKGPKGAQGSGGYQGAIGGQGPQGAGGYQGAKGTKGVQGTQGKQGKQGTQGATGSCMHGYVAYNKSTLICASNNTVTNCSVDYGIETHSYINDSLSSTTFNLHLQTNVITYITIYNAFNNSLRVIFNGCHYFRYNSFTIAAKTMATFQCILIGGYVTLIPLSYTYSLGTIIGNNIYL